MPQIQPPTFPNTHTGHELCHPVQALLPFVCLRPASALADLTRPARLGWGLHPCWTPNNTDGKVAQEQGCSPPGGFPQRQQPHRHSYPLLLLHTSSGCSGRRKLLLEQVGLKPHVGAESSLYPSQIAPHCFDDCDHVVSLEIRKWYNSSFFFSKTVFAIQCHLRFHMNFRKNFLFSGKKKALEFW